MRDRMIALIPAYEPDEKIKTIAADLKRRGFDLVIVDDGSGLEYSGLFEELAESATVLTHEQNRGKGAALKTGMRYINKYMAYTETVLTASGAETVSGRDALLAGSTSRSSLFLKWSVWLADRNGVK